MADADVTRKALTLGVRDSTTGWPAKSYTESTIKGSFDPATMRETARAAGMPLSGVPYVASPFYTANYVAQGDRIVKKNGEEYELTSVISVEYLDQFLNYTCNAEKLWKRSDRASTSGTWHTDSESTATDPRTRIKTWIDTYISHSGPIDITVFAGGDYPIEREFTELHTDLLVAIETVQSTPTYDYKHEPYKFTETVTLTCSQMDNATYTAVNTLESYEQSIRNLATDYPICDSKCVRHVSSTKPERLNIGGIWLWQNTITIEYTRVNDDYDGSGVSVTWGPSTSATGTFTIPNIIDWYFTDADGLDIRLHPLGRIGDLTHVMGLEDWEITFICDLDMEPAALTWKRPQTTAVKTDNNNYQVFQDIKFNGKYSTAQKYQTLNIGQGNTVPVRINKLDVRNSTLTVSFKRYSATAGTAYTTWYGTS
jgi:hypothetical protein